MLRFWSFLYNMLYDDVDTPTSESLIESPYNASCQVHTKAVMSNDSAESKFLHVLSSKGEIKYKKKRVLEDGNVREKGRSISNFALICWLPLCQERKKWKERRFPVTRIFDFITTELLEENDMARLIKNIFGFNCPEHQPLVCRLWPCFHGRFFKSLSE